jgi:hypothetical protein
MGVMGDGVECVWWWVVVKRKSTVSRSIAIFKGSDDDEW